MNDITPSPGGRPFTRAEFRALVGEMLRRNLAAWNNPKTPARGVTLTPQGRAGQENLSGRITCNNLDYHK